MSFIDARDRKTGNPGTAAATVRPGTAGVLLVNLGTPDGTDTRSVRRYLSEFLSDRRVIEASPLIWQPILQGIVLTLRPRRSAANYRRIWNTERDESPLRTYTRGQCAGLEARLAPDGIPVEWAMRYGVPHHGVRDRPADRARLRPHPAAAALPAIFRHHHGDGQRPGVPGADAAAAAAGAAHGAVVPGRPRLHRGAGGQRAQGAGGTGLDAGAADRLVPRAAGRVRAARRPVHHRVRADHERAAGGRSA